MTLPPTWRTWPVWARFLYGALLLYAALLCVVSLSALFQSLRQGWHLNAGDATLQTLMTLFLPLLVLGYWRPRLASGLLFAAIAVDVGLLISLSRSTGDGATVAIIASLPFLGIPMLTAAILIRRLSRQIGALRI